MAPFGADAAFLINLVGEVTHSWTTSYGATHFCYLLPNGNLFANEVCSDPKGVPPHDQRSDRERDGDSDVVWEQIDPSYYHDARRLPTDGAICIACTDPDTTTDNPFSGVVLGSETPGGMFGECLHEVNENGEIVWDYVNPHKGFHPRFGTVNWLFRMRNYEAGGSAIAGLT